jgi:hypothetical protein
MLTLRKLAKRFAEQSAARKFFDQPTSLRI